jgi:hypothetical protein
VEEAPVNKSSVLAPIAGTNLLMCLPFLTEEHMSIVPPSCSEFCLLFPCGEPGKKLQHTHYALHTNGDIQ